MNEQSQHFNKIFIYGILMIFAVVILNLLIVNPSPYLYSTYKLLSAAGIACIANSLTGFINLNLGNGSRAGGSLAIMVLIIYVYPVVGNQNSLYKGCINNDQCTDSVNHVYVVINDYINIQVRKGDVINIDDINGRIDLGPIVGVVSADGTRNGLINNTLMNSWLNKYCISKEISHGTLIFKQSHEKTWKRLSEVKRITITEDDVNFELDVNDIEKENNFGFFFVKLRISHPSKNKQNHNII